MHKDDILQTGRDVLRIEGKAVQALAESLDENFAAAVQLLSDTESRVIVTGMGKSGLVGKKIASTLASCGTPAMFIHPAEAGHGDLGMIIKKDVLIAISYSGETREIIDLLEFIKRIGIRLISITGDKNSRIAQYSDIVLEARVEQEAEPTGLVPTASSTAALAMGDALAIALMKKKGFGEKEFAFVHPKGHAGRRLLKVETLMHKGQQIPAVRPEDSMDRVLEEMSQKKFGMTCVLDHSDNLVGIITDGDLRRQMQKSGSDAMKKTAGECMTPNPITIKGKDLATTALNLMEEKKITALIVMNEDNHIQGIIHLHDLWRTQML